MRGRVPVVAGTGTNSTADSIALTRMAEELGLDGAMLVTPYYNRPTPQGQIAHFTAVAKSTKLPHHPLQRAQPHRHQHDARDARRAPERAEHRRGEGGLGQSRSDQRAARAHAVHAAVGRRLADAAADRGRRGGRDLGRRQRRAAPRCATLCDHARAGRMAEAEAHPPPAAAAVQGAVHRVESRSGQVHAARR